MNNESRYGTHRNKGKNNSQKSKTTETNKAKEGDMMTWQTTSIIVGFLVLYTKIIFDYASIKTNLSGVQEVLTELKIMLSHYDARIDRLERDLTILKTQHAEHHGGNNHAK